MRLHDGQHEDEECCQQLQFDNLRHRLDQCTQRYLQVLVPRHDSNRPENAQNSEDSHDREAFDRRECHVQYRGDHDEEVKLVPGLAQVAVLAIHYEAVSYDLNHSFNEEDDREGHVSLLVELNVSTFWIRQRRLESADRGRENDEQHDDDVEDG